MKEVQLIGVTTDQKKDTIKVKVTNVDTGKYFLVFQNPFNMTYTKTGVVTAKASATDINKALGAYYGPIFGSTTSTTLKKYYIDSAT
jgi:hypothetical protein